MKTDSPMQSEFTAHAGKRDARRAACPVAPEDIQRDDYVAALYLIGEHMTCEMLDDTWRTPRPVRVQWLPSCHEVYNVVDVCLPLLHVRDSDGDIALLDVRRYRLVRLSRGFGKKLFKRKLRKKAADKLAIGAVPV